MKMQNKREIELSVQDIQEILFDYLTKEHKLSGEFTFNFNVVNKPSGFGIRDTIDHYEFDGVKVVVTT